MGLETQIQSMIYSFVYGLFFSFLFNLHYHYLFDSKKWVQCIVSFLFLMDHVFLYFILLRYINHGVVHSYFIILIVLGCLVGNHTTKKIRKKKT